MPLDPQARAVLDQLEALALPDLTALPPADARKAFDALIPPIPPTPVAQVENRTIPGPAGEIRARIYTPAEGAPRGALVYFHGGGWVIGNLETHDLSSRDLCREAGIVVVSVDYRLAPEARFPAAAEDCYAATRWVAEQASSLGADPARIAVGGDSAGGNLAAVVSQMARDRGGPPLRFQLLIYPVTDCDFTRRSYVENAEGYLLTSGMMRWFWNHYAPDHAQREHAYASPLRAKSLAGLPPALVQTAEFDPLRDEGEAYAEALRGAGVAVRRARYDGLIHGFIGFRQGIAAAQRAFAEAAGALREALAR